MEEVCRFFESTCDVIEWYDPEEGFDQADVFYTLLEVYEYWQWRKHFVSHFASDECDHLMNENPKNVMDQPKEYYDCLSKLDDKDQEIEQLDQQMLEKAISVRGALWYP